MLSILPTREGGLDVNVLTGMMVTESFLDDHLDVLQLSQVCQGRQSLWSNAAWELIIDTSRGNILHLLFFHLIFHLREYI